MTRPREADGVIYGLTAYLLWGFAPLYFKLFTGVSPVEVLAHRVLWSVLLMAGLLALVGRLDAVAAVFRNRRVLGTALLSTSLIAGNWLGYIYAVTSGQTLQGSLGYYINPLLNVLLGAVFLRERLRRLQWIAVALAAVGVLYLTISLGQFPGLALFLAISFGFYGFVRKLAPVDALTGLTVETLILAPAALLYLGFLMNRGEAAFLAGPAWLSWALVGMGPVTSLPLLAFTAAARRLTLTLLGLLQYISPTGQFLIAVLVFREPFGAGQAVCFAFVWSALALFTFDSLRARRALRIAVAQADELRTRAEIPAVPDSSRPPGPVTDLPPPAPQRAETAPT